ncbi:MAG TPA: DUF4350 domain-containing protein, partial [Armatimonadota bacterium]|nr:DUF4350 domain-containing protein [Armatimonadota bacterium]
MANRDARPGPAAKAGSWASTLWLMVVIGLLLAGGFFLWTGDTRRGTQQPLYSVHRTDDRGAALVYRLYAEAGLKPGAWDEPLTRLKEPGMLILLEPARASYFNVGGGDGIETGREGELFPDEVKALDDWVKQGNVAVIMARQYNDLYHALGLIVDEPKGVSGTAATPAQPGVLAQGVAALQTQTSFGFKYGRKKPQAGPQVKGGGANAEDEEEPPSEAPVPQVPAEEWLELFVKKDGARSVPQVVTAARGKGLYVAVNDVFPAENIGLTTADNARFMLNLAALRPPGSAIWFDEYHKRAADRGFMTYLRERSLLPALVYVLLLVGLVLWRTGVRFGAPEPLVADRRRDSGEYVRAVAALYRNAKMS